MEIPRRADVHIAGTGLLKIYNAPKDKAVGVFVVLAVGFDRDREVEQKSKYAENREVEYIYNFAEEGQLRAW